MSRPQVSIDRLTPRRATAEPREAMNCKSCRKRKVGIAIQGPHGTLLIYGRSNVIVCGPVARRAEYSNASAYMVSSNPF